VICLANGPRSSARLGGTWLKVTTEILLLPNSSYEGHWQPKKTLRVESGQQAAACARLSSETWPPWLLVIRVLGRADGAVLRLTLTVTVPGPRAGPEAESVGVARARGQVRQTCTRSEDQFSSSDLSLKSLTSFLLERGLRFRIRRFLRT
jgi:hypothetical protein